MQAPTKSAHDDDDDDDDEIAHEMVFDQRERKLPPKTIPPKRLNGYCSVWTIEFNRGNVASIVIVVVVVVVVVAAAAAVAALSQPKRQLISANSKESERLASLFAHLGPSRCNNI